jgi:hypothetical protein
MNQLLSANDFHESIFTCFLVETGGISLGIPIITADMTSVPVGMFNKFFHFVVLVVSIDNPITQPPNLLAATVSSKFSVASQQSATVNLFEN